MEGRIDKTILRSQYLDKEWSDKKIAQAWLTNSANIKYLRQKYNIHREKEKLENALSESKLRELFIDKRKSDQVIAKEYNVKTSEVVWLRKKYGIGRHNRYGKSKIQKVDIPKKVLRRLYLEEGNTDNEIAERYNVTSYQIKYLRIRNKIFYQDRSFRRRIRSIKYVDKMQKAVKMKGKMPYWAIAKNLGVSILTVKKYIKNSKYPLRKAGNKYLQLLAS